MFSISQGLEDMDGCRETRKTFFRTDENLKALSGVAQFWVQEHKA